ncbi:MAG: shikimate dehydrogenase [Acidobacteria bacterium]|nr:shikimate dehydrogenase [Acidobacteriota bacterium]
MNNGKICVSVCAETADKTIENIKRAEEFADVVEVRFDCLRGEELTKFQFQIADLKFKKPLLVTFRSPEQGGQGSATLTERREFWSMIGNSFWAADVEEEVLDSSPNTAETVISHHDFERVPDDLDAIFQRLSASKAGVLKLAVKAHDIVDSIALWKLIEKAKDAGKQIIPIAMGDAGKWTRILGLAHGAFLTYASLDSGKETADGQITGKDMRDVYRVKKLDKNTKVYGVVGDPVSASVSPYMHNPAFAAASVNAVFVPLHVKDLDEFVRRMVKSESREVELKFGGFSVTMPHKQGILKHLDAIDPVAERIGAVNTVRIEDGKLTGFNTDAHGFITPLNTSFGDLRGTRVAVFGAGGAARAVVYALKEEGADVSVFVRDPAKAADFAKDLEVNLEQMPIANRRPPTGTEIVVNATPLGMKGVLEREALFSADELMGVKFVYDLVTKSTDTPLVAEAKKAGVPAVGGIEMLIAQGAMQFEIWTGREAPVELMRSALLAKMNR